MNNLGDFALETTFDFKFTTVNNTGLPVTLVSGEVEIYEDNSITPITGAETLTLDFNSLTGLHNVRVVATAANGFGVGQEYQVVISAGTINGISAVGYVVASFSIENRAALMPATNGRRLGVSAAGEVGADVTAVSGSAPAADNLETVFDGNEGFYPAYLGPRGPGVYLNDAAGNTNTVNGVDGTIGNPVSTIGAAKTLADSMSLDRIYLINDSNVTLAAPMEDYEFVGIGGNNQINLGSQDVDNSTFISLSLTGTQGGADRIHMHDCELAGLAALECFAYGCALTGNSTLRASMNIIFAGCHSAVAGNNTPELTFPGAGVTNLNIRHYSGGLQLNSGTALDTVSYESDGQLIIGATCTSLTVAARGNMTITDNGTTTDLTEDAALSRSTIAAEAGTDAAGKVLATPANLIATEADGMVHADLKEWLGAAMNALASGRVDGSVGAMAANVLTAAAIAGNAFTSGKFATDAISAAAFAQDAADKVFGSGAATLAELPQGQPPANPRPDQLLMLFFMALRNQNVTTGSELGIYSDADVKIAKAALSLVSGTFTRAKMVSGA
jgi:hypothetical protein